MNPAENHIKQYMHCSLCLAEIPKDTSPQEWARIQAGFTPQGIQIWCVRHDCNICHIDFEGKSPFPAEMGRIPRKGEKASNVCATH